MEKQLEIRLEIPNDLFQEDPNEENIKIKSREALEAVETGSPFREAKFVESVVIIGVVGLSWLVKRVVDHWLNKNQQGIQFDLRTTPPTMSAVANVPQGSIVIIDINGKASVKQAKYEKSDDLNGWIQSTLQSLVM